ncbi:MAG: hypothetical protein AB8E15_00405 [Bdellovibrionales bacterium]
MQTNLEVLSQLKCSDLNKPTESVMPIVRIGLLSAAFIFISYMIYFLNTTNLENSSVGHILNPDQNRYLNSVDWQWCSGELEIVEFLSQNDQQKLQLNLVSSKTSKKLKSSTKTWLTSNCSTVVQPVEALKEVPIFDQQVRFQFKNDQELSLGLSNAGYFQWNGNIYQAVKFLDALNILRQNIESKPAQ